VTHANLRSVPGWPLGARRGLASLLLAAAMLLALALPVAAASPEPAASSAPESSPTPGLLDTGDPRSNGQGPGLVGSPFAVALGVVLLGVLTAGGTLVYLRLTQRD
jgi:hypothetical protein